jgi:hypothetical protein
MSSSSSGSGRSVASRRFVRMAAGGAPLGVARGQWQWEREQMAQQEPGKWSEGGAQFRGVQSRQWDQQRTERTAMRRRKNPRIRQPMEQQQLSVNTFDIQITTCHDDGRPIASRMNEIQRENFKSSYLAE